MTTTSANVHDLTEHCCTVGSLRCGEMLGICFLDVEWQVAMRPGQLGS